MSIEVYLKIFYRTARGALESLAIDLINWSIKGLKSLNNFGRIGL